MLGQQLTSWDFKTSETFDISSLCGKQVILSPNRKLTLFINFLLLKTIFISADTRRSDSILFKPFRI